MTHALAMGISGGFMTIRLANVIWMSLVRSIVEYGSEIWGEGDFVDLEKLQISMGKRILRCGSRMTEEVVRGELGWERQKARRDELRLRYWAKLIRMQDDRIAKIIYKASRDRLEREENEHVPLTKTWCKYTRDLLKKLRLEEEWRREAVGSEAEWNELIRKRIHMREEVKWRAKCLKRPKLRTYCKLKKDLEVEPYLEVYHRVGIPELVKIRGGTNRLRIEQGRYVKESLEQRVCRCCSTGSVEDEYHFMLDCPMYEDARRIMWARFAQTTGTSKDELISKDQMLNALIGDRFQPSQDKDKPMYRNLVRSVMTFIITAMNRRRRFLE